MTKTLIQKILLVIPIIILYSLFSIPSASAQTVSLNGYAWSDAPQDPDVGGGWVSFRGLAQNGQPYGVVADTQNGNLSGYAWSESFGWLSFNLADVSGCPTAPCQPNINLYTGALTGWARFIAAPTGTSDVWNGWVRLSGSNYGVTYNNTNQQFSGYSWGDNYSGWIRWRGTAQNGAVYGVVTDASLVPPIATIAVDVVPNSASWTLREGITVIASGTGDSTATVTPAVGGTSYTITGGAPPTGYDPNPTITNTQGTGATLFLTANQSAGYTITYAVSFDYNLSNSGNVTVQKAGVPRPGQNTVTATQVAGNAQGVFLSASGVPAGVSLGISNNGCAPSSGNPCNYTLTFSVAPSAVSGTYPITITGSPLSKTTSFNLIVQDALELIVSCSASGVSRVGETVTWTANIDNNVPGAGAPYTFYWTGTNVPTGLSAPATQSFDIAYSTTGSKSVTATVMDNLSNQAQCTGLITIGANPDFGEF